MTLLLLIKRNIKLYFKDKGMVLVSMITPVILLVLYSTFLGNVYKTTFRSTLPEGIEVEQKLIDALVGGQLISSLLAVSCVTISFCANMIMIQDKYTGSIKDLTISPIKRSKLGLSYFISSYISTLIVCLLATLLCLIYQGIVGWYNSFQDTCFILLDVVILTLFGTSLSSLIHYFLKTQGQMSAVGTIVSSLYGFICGAYMPMSNFPKGLNNVLSFLPGTYGTVLLRKHCMSGVLKEFPFPNEVIENIKSSVDITYEFFGNQVTYPVMYLIIGASILLLMGIYLLINTLNKKHN